MDIDYSFGTKENHDPLGNRKRAWLEKTNKDGKVHLATIQLKAIAEGISAIEYEYDLHISGIIMFKKECDEIKVILVTSL